MRKKSLEKAVSQRLENQDNWIPRFIAWGEILAREIFDVAEKLLVVVAFGAAAKLTNSPQTEYGQAVLVGLLAVYIGARVEYYALGAFKKMGWSGSMAFPFYVAIGFGVWWFIVAKIFPPINAAMEALIVAAIK